MRKLVIIVSFVFIKSCFVFAQDDSALINSLIDDIAASQVKTSGAFYAGMFPSFRECGGAPHNYQPDNNIFFTAITAFTLKNLLPYLNSDNKKITEKIIENATAIFPNYRDQFGDPFYNF